MLLKNSFSYGWVLNTLTGIVLGVLLLDLAALIILLPTGIFLGGLVYNLTSPSLTLSSVDYSTIIITYSSVIIFGALFAHKKEKIQQQKIHTKEIQALRKRIQAVKAIGTSIAHEIRTPLAAIHMAADDIKEYWPHIIEGYSLAKQHNLPIQPLRTSQLNNINSSIDDILAEAHYANSIINMLLLKADELKVTDKDLKIYSMVACIDEALRRYPFAEGERELVEWNNKGDFLFKGNALFMVHIIFNLLKNALYYIHAARKGKVYIRLSSDGQSNTLFFKDTGTGIPAKYMKHLFERFFSKTHGGTGLGLTFVKMVMQGFGGDVVCRSVEGEYAEFELSFPKLQGIELKPEKVSL